MHESTTGGTLRAAGDETLPGSRGAGTEEWTSVKDGSTSVRGSEWAAYRSLIECYLSTGAVAEARGVVLEVARLLSDGELHICREEEAEYWVLRAETLLLGDGTLLEEPALREAGGLAKEPALREAGGLAKEPALREAGGLIDVLKAYAALAKPPARLKARVVRLEILLLERRGEFEDLLGKLAEIERDTTLRGEHAARSKVYVSGAAAAAHLGRRELAERFLRNALAEGSFTCNGGVEAGALAALGRFLLEDQRPSEALPLLLGALDLQTRHGLLRESVRTRLAVARLWHRRGLLHEALAWYGETARVSAALELPASELPARLEMALAQIQLREFREARANLVASVRLARHLRCADQLIRAYGCLASLHVHEGQPGKARVPLSLARRIMLLVHPRPDTRAGFELRASELHLACGDLKAASRAATESISIARRHGVSVTRAEACCRLGEILLVEGRREQAAHELRHAAGLFLQAGEAYGTGISEVALGKVLLALARGTRPGGAGAREAREAELQRRAEALRVRGRGIRRLERAGVPVDALDLLRQGPVAFRTRARIPGVRMHAGRGVRAKGRAGAEPARWGRYGIITRSARFHGELLHASRVAPTMLPVLIHGETGSGKEVVAAAIHRMSGRGGQFVVFNAATCRNELFEAELFGHKKGAFTGAHRDRAGVIAQAERGTLFLDEVADLTPGGQAALLRFLDNGEVRAVGSDVTRKVKTRIIAATHRSLRGLVARERFRQDLFFRLAGVEISLPSLRSRPEDILLLVRHFATTRGIREEQIEDLLSDGLGEKALSYPWPGNVRQLSHWVDQLIALLQGDVPRLQVLRVMDKALRTIRQRHGNRNSGDVLPGDQGASPSGEDLIRLLTHHKGNISAVAADLHTYRTQVYRLLRRHGLDLARYRVKKTRATHTPLDTTA